MLLNYWYPVVTSDALGTSPVSVFALDQALVLFRSGEKIAAVADLCPHRGAPLSSGKVIEGDIACPYHGIRFRLDGSCSHIPAQERIPRSLSVRSFPAVERFGLVWFWPGHPESADEALLPALPWREAKDWNKRLVQYFPVNAPANLLVENLLDLTHVAFVHEKTIGFPVSALAHDPLVMEVSETSVRNTRVFENVMPPPAHRAWRQFKGLVTRTSISEWTPPARVSILVRNEDEDGPLDVRFDHFITSETGTSCHYFVAISRNFQIDDEVITANMDQENERVHLEDKVMIEQQFANLRRHPGLRVANLKQDVAIVRAESILRRLEEAEVSR
jgi:phenylpropionate dioxygenase-like ring-hydroxylating dioxygenase large terminal subunit